MTVAQMISELDAYGFADLGESEKLVAINDAIWDISSREPWPFLEASIDLTFDGDSAVSDEWPDDFRALVSLTHQDTGRKLLFLRLDQIDRVFGDKADEVGDACAFYFQKGILNVAKVPDENVVLRMRYLLIPTAVDAETEDIIIPVQHHIAIINGALKTLYLKDDDLELSLAMEKKYEQRLVTMHDELWRQQYDTTETIEITESASWYY